MSLNDSYPLILAALCVWREARGQSPAARLGVWWSIQNRVGNPMFRPSIVRVVLQPYQYSSFNAGDPNATKFPNEVGNSLDWQAWQEILEMAEAPGPDPTMGAVYYESVPLENLDALRAKDPWFAAEKLTVTIQALRFYKA